MIELYNCDCMEFLSSEKLKENKICVVTDPPFNIGYHYNDYNDKLPREKYIYMLKEIFSNNNNPFVVIHYPETLYEIAIEMKKTPKRVCSWVYNSNLPRQHRDIAYFDITPNFNQMKQPYKNPNDKRIKERIANGSQGTRLYDWYEINQVKNVSKDKTKHPCQMPLQVMENVIGVLPKDYTIFDPFTGSGTTAIACKKLGYNFIGCELSTEYYEIAKRRIKEA